MNFDYTLNLAEALKSMEHRGAFLTVKDKDGKVNTMTIGWGNIGYAWGKPIFTVMVRKSRYTYELLENAEDFTVSVPLDDTMKDAIGFCGSKSGRDYDKFKESNITMLESNEINSPAIKNCGMVYECKIVYKQPMDPQLLDVELKNKWYTSDDYHTLYYGEIVSCYCNK